METIRLVLVPHATTLGREVSTGITHYLKLIPGTNAPEDLYCEAKLPGPIEFIDREGTPLTCVRCQGLYG